MLGKGANLNAESIPDRDRSPQYGALGFILGAFAICLAALHFYPLGGFTNDSLVRVMTSDQLLARRPDHKYAIYGWSPARMMLFLHNWYPTAMAKVMALSNGLSGTHRIYAAMQMFFFPLTMLLLLKTTNLRGSLAIFSYVADGITKINFVGAHSRLGELRLPTSFQVDVARCNLCIFDPHGSGPLPP